MQQSDKEKLLEEKIAADSHVHKEMICIGVFVLMMFLVGGLITSLLVIGTSKAYDVSLPLVLEALNSKDITKYNEKVLKAASLGNGIGNLITYLVLFIVIVLLLKEDIIKDIRKLRNFKCSFLPFVVGSAFLGTSILIQLLIAKVAPETSNQKTLEIITRYGGLVPILISSVIIGPFVEEMIYRKIVFNFLRGVSKYLAYFASMVLFALPHVLSSVVDGFSWINLLQTIPYAYSGFLLAYIYDKCEQNVFASTAVHVLNNIYAFGSVVIVYCM